MNNQSSTLTDEQKSNLKSLVDDYDNEDRAVRDAKLRRIRQQKLYWSNISNIYWSESARDYKIYNSANEAAANNNDQDYYDRPVNVYKAFLETIIAALSIQIPGISCSPDDAENPLDQSTAKAGDKAAELLYKHNNAVYLWLHAIYIYCTEGLVACYQYEKTDKAYGMYKKRNYKDEKVESYQCPHCQALIEDSVLESLKTGNPEIAAQTAESIQLSGEDLAAEQLNKFNPDEDDSDLDDELNDGAILCPECAKELDPNLQKSKLTIPKFVGLTDEPKSRICFDLFGELYIKISANARKQSDTPYLLYSYETDYANVLECYRNNKELWEKLPKGSNVPTSPDTYGQMARVNTQYRQQYPENLVSVRNCWLRPAAFNRLDEDKSGEFHKTFPNGCKVVVVNDLVVDVVAEDLDDHWTLTQNPTSDFLSQDALGELLNSVQDIINDLISLILQTIEHGIPQTWADPSVVNIDAYGQLEAMPGTVTATKPSAGSKNIGEAFYQSKASALSPEVFNFYQMINQLGQFVSAAMPSVFGGAAESGSSRTASEYAMSRTASLQRLQTPWRMFSIWWKDVFGKAIPAYFKLLKDDERYVKKDPNGSFINVWIRKSEITGRIGSVELETPDTIPISDEQKAEMIMKLFELNNQELLMAMMSPENLPFIRKVIKIPEFKLPGEADRQKQYEEIQQLVTEEPIPVNPEEIMMAAASGMQPPPPEMPSIMPDEDVDNHLVQADLCRNWLVGEAGRLAKIDNLPGYKNVLLHMKVHLEMAAAQQMMQAAMMPQEENNQNKPTGEAGSNKIKGADDAVTPVK